METEKLTLHDGHFTGNQPRPPAKTRLRETYDRAKFNHEERAYRLRLGGRQVTEIALEMSVSDRQVRTYLRRTEDRLKADLRALDGEAGVLKQFSVLNLVLEETLDAWEKSKARGHGNPAYLSLAIKASGEIRELLGMDAATFRKIVLLEGTHEQSERLTQDELSKLPTDKLLALYRARIGLS